LDPSQKSATLHSGGGRPLTLREKLMNFASAATEHPAFARELPRLSPKCDVCFRPTERDAEYRETDEDEFHYESPARAAERVRQFATIKDLLTADTPGTS
jgi:hypothetical protein